ncbi:hypothetical protein GQ457_02G026470 [Hibiscus cannabinus]
MVVASLGILFSNALPPHEGMIRSSNMDAEVSPLSPAPSVASSTPASTSAAAASVPAPAASDAAASVPVSAPVGPAPAASDAAASDVHVTAGRVAAGSAPIPVPPPRGKGRAITDNILVAHELVHTLHTSVSRSSQGAVFKLDMEKAFDRVEWPFLKVVMLRLGFVQSWVDLIMRCVSSVSSRVRLRGTLSEAFLPRRGLRQGVPLSPFLFLFCTEGLSAALTAAQREGHLPGVRASKHGPPFNHLLFADGSLVFMRNDMSEVHYLKDILSTYSAVSEQKFNFSKSTAYFSPHTPSNYRVSMHEALGVQEVSDPGIYLGVPLLIGKNKYAAFGCYRDKMDACVSKWSNLLLSFSGAVEGLPFLWDLTLGTHDYRMVLARFVVLVLRTPFTPFGTILTRPWLFARSEIYGSSSHPPLGPLATSEHVGTRAYPLPVAPGRWQCCLALSRLCLCLSPPPPPTAPSSDAAPSAAALPRWRPPPTGSVKINVDGAFLPSAHLGAIGVLARDSSGSVLGGFARPVPALGPTSSVEASALLAGLEYATANGWASVLVESDAAVLINKLHRPSPNLPLLGGLIAPSRDLLAASHGRLRVGFVPRSANSAAHTLASWACQSNDVISFTLICPELISRIVLDDLSSSF